MTGAEFGIGRILLGVDGSDESAKALAWTRRLAQTVGASVTVVCAFDTPWSFRRSGGNVLEGVKEALQGEAEQIVREAVAELAAAGVEASAVAFEGTAIDAVISLCEGRGADIVVIGGGGHEGATDLLLGTTAERIVKHSPVPVLVVK